MRLMRALRREFGHVPDRVGQVGWHGAEESHRVARTAVSCADLGGFKRAKWCGGVDDRLVDG